MLLLIKYLLVAARILAFKYQILAALDFFNIIKQYAFADRQKLVPIGEKKLLLIRILDIMMAFLKYC
jgi:hypothetical protein